MILDSDISAALERDEGSVPYAYKDSRGYWTIGNGFLIDKDQGGRLPDPVRKFWLAYLIDQAKAELTKDHPWWTTLPDVVQLGMINLFYNMGEVRFDGFHQMIAHLEAKDFPAAADALMDSLYEKQVGKRADRIADLFRSATA